MQSRIPWWVNVALQDRTPNRTIWCVGGLGSGKSHGGQIWDIARVLENAVPISDPKPSLSWTVAPNYRICDTLLELTMQVAYDNFRLKEGRDYDLRKQFPRTLYFNKMKLNHKLQFLSADNPQHFVSASITHWRWSEVGVSKEDVFDKLHDRLRDKRAKVLQGLGDGTPEGTQHKYYEWAGFGGTALKAYDDARNFLKFRIETGHNIENLSAGYLDALRSRYSYDPQKILSYEKGLFVPFNKGSAYWEFKEQRNVWDNIDPNPDLTINLDFDFNISPLAWCSSQDMWLSRGYYDEKIKRSITIHETEGHARGLMDACAEFASFHPLDLYRYTKIEIDGDVNGFTRNHRLAGSSFEDIQKYLKKIGYENVEIVAVKGTSNPSQKDRLEKVAQLMAYGVYVVCSRCRNTIQSFNKTCLKKGTWDIEKSGDDTWSHYGDAVGYRLYRVYKDRDILDPNSKSIRGFA